MPPCNFEILPARGVVECAVLDNQRLDVALHGCQWRAQVMGDVGDQLAAQPVVFLQCRQLLLNRLGHVMTGIPQLIDLIPWPVRRGDRAAGVETAGRKRRDLAR